MNYFALHCAVIPARVAVRASAFHSGRWDNGGEQLFQSSAVGLGKLGPVDLIQLKHSVNKELTQFFKKCLFL